MTTDFGARRVPDTLDNVRTIERIPLRRVDGLCDEVIHRAGDVGRVLFVRPALAGRVFRSGSVE